MELTNSDLDNLNDNGVLAFMATCSLFESLWKTPYEKGDSIGVAVEDNSGTMVEGFWITFDRFEKDEETGKTKIIGVIEDELSGDFDFNSGDIVALDRSCVVYNKKTLIRVMKEWDNVWQYLKENLDCFK